MSDAIGHECGLVCVRLRRPLSHYLEKYGDPLWGLRRLYLLMEKQRNRGQDGAGIAVAKFDMKPGDPYLLRYRSADVNPTEAVFKYVFRNMRRLKKFDPHDFDERRAKKAIEFLGEVYIGHLRYGTYSGYGVRMCQPYIRRHNQPSRNLAIAGNFNMTNAPELFARLVEYGLHPAGDSDTQVVLEKLSWSLDQEHEHLRQSMGPGSLRNLEGQDLAELVSRDLDVARVLRRAAASWDGGYAFIGLIGNGDAFVCRDPAGIRPGFWYMNDEIVATASERSALVTVFDASPDDIRAIQPAHALIIKRDPAAVPEEIPFAEPTERRECTFERVYFSRGNDRDIYQERKNLGRELAPRVLDAIDWDVERTVFSFIPNTAEPAFIGLTQEVERLVQQRRADQLWKRIEEGTVKREDLSYYMNGRPRIEKAAHKDQKLRTFITRELGRSEIVSHVYDITPGVVNDGDTLVVIDDSIVRGTTLRDSIITMLSRLNPRKIIVASSAPPIRYPDCYGIDMSQLGRFIAFEAAVSLLHDRGDTRLLKEIEDRCRAQAEFPPEMMKNHVALLYDQFSFEEISAKVADLVRSEKLEWKGEIRVIYQTVEGLLASMPGYTGDWYFTGRYPTPGGYKVLNTAYLNWIDKVDMRAY
jgi:amidophosphoribosyltransferase